MAEFTYRGQSIEELKKLDIREFTKFLKSRARRAILKQFDKIEKFLEKCQKAKQEGKLIKTHLRHLIVVPNMVDLDIQVHNGHEYVKIKIMPEMLGHKLGEFALTRRKVQHGAAGIGATRSSASRSVK